MTATKFTRFARRTFYTDGEVIVTKQAADADTLDATRDLARRTLVWDDVQSVQIIDGFSTVETLIK